MRNILFRGKRLDNEAWVYGDLIENQGRYFIYHAMSETTIEDNDDGRIVVAAVEVNPDTVGQYTGLKDRYGDRIWEGDLVKHGDEVSAVFFDTENSCFDFKASNDPFAAQFFCDYEILGNIHDNPELLK